MDQTECFNIPFPECDPPLTKDASDIEQFRDLAIGVDSAVQQLADNITEFLEQPDAARMSGALGAAGRIQDIPYTAVDFDNSGMASVTDTRLRMVTDGWYWVGGWVIALGGATVDPAGIGMRVQPTINGDPVDNRQGPGRPTFGAANTADNVAWSTVMSLSAGDLLGLRINHAASAALTVNYTSNIWAVRIVTNV